MGLSKLNEEPNPRSYDYIKFLRFLREKNINCHLRLMIQKYKKKIIIYVRTFEIKHLSA